MAENQRTDEAMNAVLRAEQESREAVAHCEEQALARREAIQDQARRIRARADQRIGRIHAYCADLNARKVESLHGNENETARRLPAEHEQELLLAAVRTLAARLTGSGET